MKKRRKYGIVLMVLIINILFVSQIYAEELPEKFDLRDKIKIEVKDQKNTGDCWIFATMSVAEINILMRNNEEYNFSERHLKYSTLSTFKDNQHNIFGFNKEATGGFYFESFSYMTRGYGPVNEEEMPFENNSDIIGIQEIEGKKVQKKLEDFIIFPSIFKEALLFTNENGESDSVMRYYKLEPIQALETTVFSDNVEEISPEELKEIRDIKKRHIMEYGALTANLEAYTDTKKIIEECKYPLWYYRGWYKNL